MNTPEMSKQVCPSVYGQSDANSICTTNNKRKKLSLSKELLSDIEQFKRMLVMQKENYEIGFIDPVNGEQLKLMCTDTVSTGRVLHAGVRTLQAAIIRERSHRREYVDGLTLYTRELDQLDGAKEELLDGLERMRAGVDGVVDELRSDVERAHGEYEERKRRYIRLCDGVMDEYESTAALRFRALNVSSTDYGGAAGRMNDTDRDADDIDRDADDIDRDADDIDRDADDIDRDADDIDRDADDIDRDADDIDRDADDTDRDADDTTVHTVFQRLLRDAEVHGGDGCQARTEELMTLWHAVRSVAENNRMLETAARALDGQTETLQASLRGAAAVCRALDVDKSVKKCRAVVLDDFCAVTEQITAQQIRNLEFGRMLAVDEREIGEELHKISQLQAKVSRKKEKRQKLLEQTDSMKSQLEAYKYYYEDLKSKKAHLDDNLKMVKCSPSKLANQSELGQRVKHLEQLRNQYFKLTNQRDALKLKIQSQQQAVKNPHRINQFCNP